MFIHTHLATAMLLASVTVSLSVEISETDIKTFFRILTGEMPRPGAPADSGSDRRSGSNRTPSSRGTGSLGGRRVPGSAIISVAPAEGGRNRPSVTESPNSMVAALVQILDSSNSGSEPVTEAGSGNANGNMNEGENNGNNNGNCRGNCQGNQSGNGNGNENESSDNGNNNGNCVGNCFFNRMGNANGNANTRNNQGNNNGNCFGNCFHRFAGNNVGNEDSEGQVNGVGNCVGNCFTIPSFVLQSNFGDLGKYEMEKETPQCYNEGSFYRPIDGTFCRGVERTYMIGSGSDAIVADTRYLCHPGCVFDYKICGCQHWFMVSYKTCSSGVRA